MLSQDRSEREDATDCNSHNDGVTELVVHSPEEASLQTLATKLAEMYRQLVNNRRGEAQTDARQADTEVQQLLQATWQDLTNEAGVLSMSPHEIGWFHLTALAEHNTSAMLRGWQALYQAALDEFISGHRAALAVAMKGETPWERAQFLALRSSLALEWQPRGGIEWSLIDTMAQALALEGEWLRRLTAATETQSEYMRSNYSARGLKESPRISDAQAVQQAAEMVDRFNRLFLRTLRQLRDLRRYTGAVTIQNADQVSIGGQQINMASDC